MTTSDEHIGVYKKGAHLRLLSIAIPLILANITTPLLGLVDTAILGRMDGVHYLAGAAIGSLILTQLYWICGFIKMSLTGLSAQTKSGTGSEQIKVLVQGLALGLVLAFMILVLQSPLLNGGLWFASAQEQVVQSTQDYFYVRVWGAPAALMNLAIIGWLVGQQKGQLILILQVIVNLVNIAASLCFVYVLDMGVQGVAAGTLLAEYCMSVCALIWIHKRYISLQLTLEWFALKDIKSLLSLNTNMLIRNLFLQFTLAFVTLKGAQFGAQAAAVNAILMQFFALIALGLDGIANAVEALVGDAKGSVKHKSELTANSALNAQVKLGLVWSSAVALLYTLIFYVFIEAIITLLTNQDELISAVLDYEWVILLLPIIAHWCFLFDGVYVGLTRGHTMRNNMIMSTSLAFLPCYFIFSDLQNQALWLAMFAFLIARGCGLGCHYYFRIARSAYP